MTHKDADQKMATESYLLGEMTGEEASAFEEHMFDCSECAAAVRNGAAFIQNARSVFKENPGMFAASAMDDKAAGHVGFFWKWFSFPQLATSFAALALLCVAGYQQQVISRLRAPHSVPNFALIAVERSGDVDAPVIPANVDTYLFRIDSVSKKCSTGCFGRIQGSRGQIGPDIGITLSSDRTALIELTRALTPPGQYTVVVHTNGPGGEEVGQYPFRVE